jgi:hypothetical protein
MGVWDMSTAKAGCSEKGNWRNELWRRERGGGSKIIQFNTSRSDASPLVLFLFLFFIAHLYLLRSFSFQTQTLGSNCEHIVVLSVQPSFHLVFVN